MAAIGANSLDAAELAKAGVPDATLQGTVKELAAGEGRMSISAPSLGQARVEVYEDTPTEEEMHTLRRVSGKIPWTAQYAQEAWTM